MADIIKLLLAFIRDCLRSPEQLRAENVALRHQLNVLCRKTPNRPQLSGSDKALFVWLYPFFPGILGAIRIIQPETLIGWHRAGFRAWWRRNSRNRGGRPKIDRELRDLIRRMCEEEPLGRAAHSRRAIEACVRCRTVDGVDVHAARTKTAISRLEDLPADYPGQFS